MIDVLVVMAFSWRFKRENAAKALHCLRISGIHLYLPLPTQMNLAPQYLSHTHTG